jgi:menaquinone-dependent protoporphyrinogen IX oxidase
MTRVLIAFASDRGATRQMAHAVAEGAASVPGATVDLRELADERVTEISLDDARAATR